MSRSINISIAIFMCTLLSSCLKQMANDFSGLEGEWASKTLGCEGSYRVLINKDSLYGFIDGHYNPEDGITHVKYRKGDKQYGNLILIGSNSPADTHMKYEGNNITFEKFVYPNGEASREYTVNLYPEVMAKIDWIKCENKLGLIPPK